MDRYRRHKTSKWPQGDGLFHHVSVHCDTLISCALEIFLLTYLLTYEYIGQYIYSILIIICFSKYIQFTYTHHGNFDPHTPVQRRSENSVGPNCPRSAFYALCDLAVFFINAFTNNINNNITIQEYFLFICNFLWLSYGPKSTTGTGRQYLRTL